MTESNWGADEGIWQTISPPLIPTQQDIELVQRACPRQLLAENAAPHILFLGVTPGLVDASWPEQSRLHAVDYDQTMIDLLWTPRNQAHCHRAYWQTMPFPDNYFDLVIGDCSFNALPGIQDYGAVLNEIDRVRRPSAPLISRFFMQSDPRHSLTGLQAEASGPLAGCSSAAMRLLIAIAASDENGSLNFADIPARISAECGDVDDFLASAGQNPGEIERAKKTYLGGQRLNYPNKTQISGEFDKYFKEIHYHYPDYDGGNNCPTISFY